MKYLKYIIGILIIVVPCIVTVLIYNDKITQNSPLYYKQGVQFYNDGDYSNAYYNFGKIKWISPLYPAALYKQAKSAQKVGDFKTAAIKYKLFLEKLPNSIFDLKAKLNLGKSYFYSKQYQEAKIQFEELYKKANNLGTEEVFFLGLIEKNNDKKQAYEYFKGYLESALSNKALNNNYILSSAEELSSLGYELSSKDKLLLGKAYYKTDKYKKALEYLSQIPISSCWDYFVLANHYAGNKVIAKKLIESGLPVYAALSEEENLNEIYDIYASYLIGTKKKNWTQILKTVKEKSIKGEDYVLYQLAEISPQEEGIILYNEIIKKYPESKYGPDAIWKVFWDKYKKRDYKSAEQLAIKHINTYKNIDSTPKIAFWLAKTAIKQNKLSEAHNYLSKITNKYPDNYYGLRAENILNKKNDFWTTNNTNKIPSQKDEIEFPISMSQFEIKDIKMINTLFEMGDYEIWSDANFNNPIVESWFALKRDKKAQSIVLARDEIDKMDIKPPFISASYKLAYPRHWVDEINIAGNKLGLDPFLIAALIREESYFNEYAKSSTGAIGLMQLMPQTANYMISKLTSNIASIQNIENPRTNLYIGCNYLKYLKEQFNDDLMVIAAYNGGEGSVRRWMKKYGTNDYDEFIEEIPYEETQNYVKKVFRSYHMYQKIYQ